MREMRLGPVVTAMITPFDDDLSLNLNEASRLAKHLEATGTTSILVAGTTGESPTLSDDEKLELYQAVRDSVSIPVMVGVGTNSTAKTFKLLKRFENLPTPPDYYLVVTPYYNKPPQDALVRHFYSVADEASRPVMVYNIPSRTGTEILPRTIVELAKHDNIKALKQAVASLDRLSEISSLLRENGLELEIYSGDDSLTLPMLSVGAVGVVSVASHVAGREMRQMIEAFEAGKTSEALEMHLKLFPLFKNLFITTNPIPVKAALELMGFNVNNLRPPLRRATDGEVEVIRETLLRLGYLKETTNILRRR